MSRPPFRDGRVHVMAERCATCVFRPGNLMQLREGRLADLVRTNLDADTAFACHETLYDDVDEALCRGYVDAYGDRVTPVRVAAALGLLQDVDS